METMAIRKKNIIARFFDWLIKLIKRIFHGKEIREIRYNLPKFESAAKERIAILELLLWKHHSEGIPYDVVGRMKANGFLVPDEDRPGSFRFSEVADHLSNVFNKRFGY